MAAVAAALLAASPALATNGMRMIGFSPIQNSMGGVSIAVPLDAATVMTNPAGLLSVGRRMDVGATYFKPTVEYTAAQVPGFPPDMVAQNGKTIESDRGASYIPSVAASWALSDKLAAGVGVFGVGGMGVDDPVNLYSGKTETSYMQARLAPGVAYQVAPGLSAGVTLNAMYAMMNYDVAAGMGMPPRDDGTAFGVGATVGLMYTPMEMLTVGAAYETRSWFQDFEFDVPAHQLFVGFDGSGNPQFAPIPGGKEKLDFDQPPVASVGVSVRPVPGLVLALDGEYIFWSQTNGKDQPELASAQGQTGARAFDLNWDDQLVVKVGAQYSVVPAVKVRLGYNYGKQPLDSTRAFENIAFPAIAEHHITAGVGVDLGKATLNAGLMYVPQAKISGAQPEQFIASYESKMSQFSFDLGAAYRF